MFHNNPGAHLVLDEDLLRLDSRAPFPFKVKVVLKTGEVEWPVLYGDGSVGWQEPQRIPKYVAAEALKMLQERQSAIHQLKDYRSSRPRP